MYLYIATDLPLGFLRDTTLSFFFIIVDPFPGFLAHLEIFMEDPVQIQNKSE